MWYGVLLWWCGSAFVVVSLCWLLFGFSDCGFVVVWLCFCGGVVVFLWLCFCVLVIVFLWWCGCVFVFCGGVALFLCWCGVWL